MKSTSDTAIRQNIISRIQSLKETDMALWGTMNVYQMAKHCRMWEEMIHGARPCKRIFIGRLIGRLVLPGVVKDDKQMMRGAVTSPELIVAETIGDLEGEKRQWILLLENPALTASMVHPFFGTMTLEQVGILAYKHHDHHLRQFGK